MRSAASQAPSKKQSGGEKPSPTPERQRPPARPGKDVDERSKQDRDREDADLDETGKQSFPASDPPAWTLGVNIPGERSPRRHDVDR